MKNYTNIFTEARIHQFIIFIYVMLVGLCLIQIWLPTYFVTGDGACHLYNASVLSDLFLGKHESFYNSYYQINHQINANWVSHLLLALLLMFFKAAIAEKIILSIYFILFSAGFYKLLNLIQGKKTSLLLMIPLFVFSSLLLSGFYNFLLSISLFPWIIFFVLKSIETPHYKTIIYISAFTLLSYLSHPMGAIYVWMYEFFILIVYLISSLSKEKRLTQKNIQLIGLLLIANLPVLILFFSYLSNQDSFKLIYHPERWDALIDLKMLAIRTSSEYLTLKIAGKLLAVVTILSIFYTRITNLFIAFFMIVILSLFIYLYFPDMLLNGGVFVFRAQWLFYLAFVCFLASIDMPKLMSTAIGTICSICFLYLSYIRMPVSIACSKQIENYMPALQFIQSEKTILPLTFEKCGVHEGDSIADICWVNQHGFDYLGTEKPLILLDNYEGTTTNFPLQWTSFDPYHFETLTGIEGIPPFAELDLYNKNIRLDYIITWYYNPLKHNDSNTNSMMKKINSEYHLIYQSKDDHVHLYERND